SGCTAALTSGTAIRRLGFGGSEHPDFWGSGTRRLEVAKRPTCLRLSARSSTAKETYSATSKCVLSPRAAKAECRSSASSAIRSPCRESGLDDRSIPPRNPGGRSVASLAAKTIELALELAGHGLGVVEPEQGAVDRLPEAASDAAE